MSEYPDNDTQFQDHTIEAVRDEGDGSFSIICEGWSLLCGRDSPVTPKVGQTARYYGKGPVRGLFIDGVKVWYRTEAEDEEHQEVQLYGRDPAEWLERWDAGRSVWTIEMGGLGPGYEQCIHIICAEVLRWLLANKPDMDDYKSWRDTMDKAVLAVPYVKEIGCSGAQWGAAVNIAAHLYRKGPRGVMTDEAVKDRHIQVSKSFPSVAESIKSIADRVICKGVANA